MKRFLPNLKFLFFALLIFTAFGRLQAQNVIRGIITDENNEPLPGVSVLLKGTTTGTVTGDGGRFTISANRGQTLVISFIGYDTREVVIGAEPNLSLQLNATTKNLSEVVVTALGVRKEVQKLGYSQTQIRGEELTTARDANPLNSLAGKVAGLSIGWRQLRVFWYTNSCA